MNDQAYKSGNSDGYDDYRVIQQRKTRTFYYEPFDTSDFNLMIDKIGIEPAVQFTLYMRVQQELKNIIQDYGNQSNRL